MRPTKTTETKRSRQVSFRLTEAEYQRLAAVAERVGVRPNDMARTFVTKRDHEITAAPDHSYDPAVVKRLDRVGWNLNQLVRNAHIYKSVPPTAAQLCEEIRALVKAAVLARVKE